MILRVEKCRFLNVFNVITITWLGPTRIQWKEKTEHESRADLTPLHYFEWIIQKSNRGGTQKFIALRDIRSFPIPVPDQGRQKKFGDFCRKFKTLHIKKNNMDSIETNLFHSLTQRAFRGEL